MLNLEWGQIDLDHAFLIISAQEIKGGRDLKLPLAPEAVKLLEELTRHTESDYVFCKASGQPYRDIYSGFRSAFKWAGIKDCTLHTVKHTVAAIW